MDTKKTFSVNIASNIVEQNKLIQLSENSGHISGRSRTIHVHKNFLHLLNDNIKSSLINVKKGVTRTFNKRKCIYKEFLMPSVEKLYQECVESTNIKKLINEVSVKKSLSNEEILKLKNQLRTDLSKISQQIIVAQKKVNFYELLDYLSGKAKYWLETVEKEVFEIPHSKQFIHHTHFILPAKHSSKFLDISSFSSVCKKHCEMEQYVQNFSQELRNSPENYSKINVRKPIELLQQNDTYFYENCVIPLEKKEIKIYIENANFNLNINQLSHLRSKNERDIFLCNARLHRKM